MFVICAGNQYVRARRIAKQRLHEAAASHGKAARPRFLKQSGLIDRTACDRAGSQPPTQASLCLKRIRRQGAARITKRAKALATNALDAVGQRQTRSTPSGQPHNHKQKAASGSSGSGKPPNKACPPSCAPRGRPSRATGLHHVASPEQSQRKSTWVKPASPTGELRGRRGGGRRARPVSPKKDRRQPAASPACRDRSTARRRDLDHYSSIAVPGPGQGLYAHKSPFTDLDEVLALKGPSLDAIYDVTPSTSSSARRNA